MMTRCPLLRMLPLVVVTLYVLHGRGMEKRKSIGGLGSSPHVQEDKGLYH